MEIWINPACSKCQNALSALEGAGVKYTVRRYLEEPQRYLRHVLD